MTTRNVLMIVGTVLAIAAGAAVALAQGEKVTICRHTGSTSYTTSVLRSELGRYAPYDLGPCKLSPSK